MQVVSAGASQIILNLTHALDTTLCDFTYPLTLRTEVPATWDSVTVVQGSNPATAHPVTDSGKQYVYFSAQPNKGEVTLSAAAPTAIWPGKLQNPVKKINPVYPNPVRVEALRHYLEANGNALIYDLAGKPVNLARRPQAGLYVWQGAPGNPRKKILVAE